MSFCRFVILLIAKEAKGQRIMIGAAKLYIYEIERFVSTSISVPNGCLFILQKGIISSLRISLRDAFISKNHKNVTVFANKR